ncbi:hypothetical protein K8I85_09130 [bacterium]|nr:hypothetical protein [bacterium]
MFRTLSPLVLFALLLSRPSAAAEPATDEQPEVSVKVSLSREDPNERLGEWKERDPLEFFVFLDGVQTRGAEFGLDIQGAKFLSFRTDTTTLWLSMPMQDPYPGTIAQVVVGPDCLAPPTLFGTLAVLPDEPGGRIIVDVIPSMRSNKAMGMDCENLPLTNVRAYPATVNDAGKPARTHELRGD